MTEWKTVKEYNDITYPRADGMARNFRQYPWRS
jgi:hypothetical protein